MRIRFTIRDLLLSTTIVALAVGWWLDHRQITRNANLESMLSKDTMIVRLQAEISELDFARSVQTDNAIKTSIDVRIADRQKQIDKRRDELLHALP
jgi:hypothetical protein